MFRTLAPVLPVKALLSCLRTIRKGLFCVRRTAFGLSGKGLTRGAIRARRAAQSLLGVPRTRQGRPPGG